MCVIPHPLSTNPNDGLMLYAIDKQVFPSLEFIGWYTVAERPASRHIALHEQVGSGGSD